MDNESRSQSQSPTKPRSESKIAAGQKRTVSQAEETSESSQRRVKSRVVENYQSKKVQDGTGGSNATNPNVNSGSGFLDLIVSASRICSNAAEKSCKAPPKETKKREFDFDLNADDKSSPMSKLLSLKHEYPKARDDSDCASSVGPLEKNSMKVWQGLKQNNYLSNSYAAASNAIPKPRGKKKVINDEAKRIELAKKEQTDRFAKVAAPSGLLNELNPGIINHVRNSKQVHAIIESLVKSERTKSQHSGSKNNRQAEREDSTGIRISRMNHGSVLSERRQITPPKPLDEQKNLKPDFSRGSDDFYMGGIKIIGKLPSQPANKDDRLSLKLRSENTGCLSNEGFLNVDSLSVEAANVALQWLQLLNNDIKGRLAVLRRSKRRVENVITKELPLLVIKEFSSNPEKHLCTAEGSHASRWNARFRQMVSSLSEEETNLESWLQQVNQMQLHCEKAVIPTENILKEAHKISDGGLAVTASAAAIYSTCNFLMAMHNQPSC
ncbi:uncharacterized protein LOC127245881 [Andrographis paniculata]|uniref:uncharacterized protein LOC127245881 n=1 Tax=Andrographis paniculata TaxID=175694 RepID=UPI0021E84703|nr:uncharacterized protein LOC127245881 [Andrographis paniculata]